MKKLYIYISFLLLTSSLLAQHQATQIYEELGISTKVLTLSEGKYQESFTSDTLLAMGSVLFNRVIGEVESIVVQDTLYAEYALRGEVVSRFLSIDPLARQFAFYTPYQFAGNSPIANIDLDGLEQYYAADGEYLGKYGTSQEVRIVNSDENKNAVKRDLSNPSLTHKGYFDFYLPSHSNKLSESNRAAQSNVLQSIYKNELKLNFSDLKEPYIIAEEGDFLAACYCSGDRRHIVVSMTKSYSNNKNFLINALQKENTHVYDEEIEKKYGNIEREMNGYIRAVSESSFKNAPDEYKKDFLQGAGVFLWTYLNEAEANPEQSDAYRSAANRHIKALKKYGVELDFSVLYSKLRGIQESYNTKRTRDVRYNANNFEVKVKHNGKDL